MSTRADERPASRTRERVVPQRSAEFEHLALPALREHRKALTAEESKVSYWRRLIQARMDLIDLKGGDDPVRLERLRQALSETRIGVGRQAMVEIAQSEDSPPLPDLDALWSREAHPDLPVETGVLRNDLAFAELQLSAYRAALHRRLANATTELIARYREEPTLALLALPIPADELL
jgi:RsiG-like